MLFAPNPLKLFNFYFLDLSSMQTLLTKALATSVAVAGLGLLAAPQAKALSFDQATLPAFFGGGTLSTTGFTATGFSSTIPAVVSGPFSNVTLQQGSDAIVSLVVNLSPAAQAPLITLPTTFSYSYTLNSLTQAFTLASANLNPSQASTTVALLTKEIYDFNPANGGTLLATATFDQNGTIGTSNPVVFSSGLTSLFIVDTLQLTAGGVASLTNTYQVPEPLTMLGASAAIAFGAAFKRRNANKG